MTIKNLVQHFGTVEDPRCRGKILHRLEEILVIAVRAVIACAESWDDIALYGRSKLAWLRTFLELPNGIPSHDTFRRVFMLIAPDAFEAGFTANTRGAYRRHSVRRPRSGDYMTKGLARSRSASGSVFPGPASGASSMLCRAPSWRSQGGQAVSTFAEITTRTTARPA